MRRPRCENYGITSGNGAPLAVRCRRRARWRVAAHWSVCAACLPGVLALRATPTSIEELK